jgi:hypothetical protein
MQWSATDRKARLDELLGNIEAADADWKLSMKSATIGPDLDGYADFLQRQGRFDEALQAESAEFDQIPKNTPSDDLFASTALKVAYLKWATGKPADALSLTASVMDRLSRAWDNGNHNLRFLQPTALLYNALASSTIGIEQERKKAAAKLDEYGGESSQTFVARFKYDIAVAGLRDDGDIPREVARREEEQVLKSAPHLDWALWSELYLCLDSPDSVKRALDHMPTKCIQRTILTKTPLISATSPTIEEQYEKELKEGGTK